MAVHSFNNYLQSTVPGSDPRTGNTEVKEADKTPFPGGAHISVGQTVNEQQTEKVCFIVCSKEKRLSDKKRNRAGYTDDGWG